MLSQPSFWPFLALKLFTCRPARESYAKSSYDQEVDVDQDIAHLQRENRMEWWATLLCAIPLPSFMLLCCVYVLSLICDEQEAAETSAYGRTSRQVHLAYHTFP